MDQIADIRVSARTLVSSPDPDVINLEIVLFQPGAKARAAYGPAPEIDAGAAVSAVLTLRSQRLQRDIEHMRFAMQKQLDEYKAEQQQVLAETNALTAYRFDARKRLYTECEPIFFHLIEAADFALRKSRDLANPRTWEQLRAEKTNVERGSSDWMLNNSSDLIGVTP